ncbi:hypothetical protein CPB85DRAFT_719562 [Mucidula mucida]|nr:hypothetical protein CPB85DRAFT_719562 [Mucidula mucida]
MFPINSIASSSSFNWYSPSPDPNFNSIRGKACGECRRRKVKCDGGLPVCGRCSAAGHDEDCEYVLDDGLTRSEMLEQDIEALQARIRELESRPKHERSAHQALYSSGTPHPSSAIRNPSRRGTPDIILPEVLHVFFQHASQLGVFLNRSRLTEALYALPHNSILRIPPHPTYSPFLFRAIFLLGLRLSNPEVSQAHEPALLAKTIQASIAPSQPEYILSHMQAEVLLAHYFLIQGRLIEAMDHINAAVSLGIGSSLTGKCPHHSICPTQNVGRGTAMASYNPGVCDTNRLLLPGLVE